MAVSEEITDWQELPEVFSGLEEVLAEKFYQPRQKIFFAGEVQETRERSLSVTIGRRMSWIRMASK